MSYIVGFFVVLALSMVGVVYWYVSIPLALIFHIMPSLKKQGERKRFETYKLHVSLLGLIVGFLLLVVGVILVCWDRADGDAHGIAFLGTFMFAIGFVTFICAGKVYDTPEEIEEEIINSPFNPSKLSDLHTKEQVVRWYRAVNGELQVKNLNKQKREALFARRSNPKEHYRTTLKTCTCPDFDKTKPLPCKHMYYLANELGLLENFEESLPKEHEKIINDYKKTLYSRDLNGWERQRRE